MLGTEYTESASARSETGVEHAALQKTFEILV